MRILVTGASGLLGGRLATLLSAHHEVTGITRRHLAPKNLDALTADLAEPGALAPVLAQARPEAVVHCAALADAEVCEREPERAARDNEVATLNLARACASASCRLIMISTDLVASGQAAFSSENARPAPVMEYGRSKLRAEAAAERACPEAVILRVALVCGRGHGPRLSASENVAARLRRGETVTLYEDEWRTPVDPESVAGAVEAILLRPRTRGVFHIGGPERLTRFELGVRVALVLGLDPSLLLRASQASHPGAPRARDVSLDHGKARAELDWSPRPLDEAVREGREAPD